MCGIAGILNFDGSTVPHESLKKVTDILKHRGPDDEGIWIKKNIGFGHRRLSIIDLSEKANQPMISNSTNTIIIFNGEIYNYQVLRKELLGNGMAFRTNSDTEVIIKLEHLFEKEFVHRLRSMFVIALYDKLQ